MANGDVVPRAKRARHEENGFRVVFPGEECSFAYIAAKRFFQDHPTAILSGMPSHGSCFGAVSSGEADFAVVPIENSASGTLHTTYDFLVKHDVTICGEMGVQEVYSLCAKPGVQLKDVGRVLSHPVILDACSHFIKTRLPREHVDGHCGGIDFVPTRSTTDAARRLAAETAETGDGVLAAAISTKEAATRNNLQILKQDIGNEGFLEARYVLVRAQEGSVANVTPPFPLDSTNHTVKRSMCCALKNEPGAIFKLLSCLALRDISVLKVETRPMGARSRAPPGIPSSVTNLWEYLFYVDYAVPPGQTEEAAARLFASMGEFTTWQRCLGTYKSQSTQAPKQEPSWEEMVDLMAKC
eukprot:TRINITY_DN51099_c0_g1_i1.p1 TRINITY_DN51099_c0_g1~~TRINITY_DN51099_c0_g1_i1.p1  ORF type:complete len:393 (+),score=59.15 TRINITY_DN51099_c0_g1_i1:115-1179(+)